MLTEIKLQKEWLFLNNQLQTIYKKPAGGPAGFFYGYRCLIKRTGCVKDVSFGPDNYRDENFYTKKTPTSLRPRRFNTKFLAQTKTLISTLS